MLLRMRSILSDLVLMTRPMHAGRNDVFSAVSFYFHDAQPAPAERLQFVVVAKGGDRYSSTSGSLENGHSLLCLYLVAVNLHADLAHCCLLFLMTVL